TCSAWRLPIPRPPGPPLLPYTTLFRSREGERQPDVDVARQPVERLRPAGDVAGGVEHHVDDHQDPVAGDHEGGPREAEQGQAGRSEEHTSELQSRENLVCRLRLEKKKG